MVDPPPGGRQHPDDALGGRREPFELHGHRVAQRVGKGVRARRTEQLLGEERVPLRAREQAIEARGSRKRAQDRGDVIGEIGSREGL